MAVGDLFRLAAVGGLNGQQIVNVFHYQQTTANTSGVTETESLARAWNAQVFPDLLAAITSDAQYGIIESRSFVMPGGVLVGYDLPVSTVGGEDPPTLPPTVAVVIRKKTSRLGRKYRGRNYFAGVAVADVSAGSLVTSGTTLTRWNALATAMLVNPVWTASGSPTFTPVIAAYDKDEDGVPIALRSQPLTTTFLDMILRSQRRREIGVGA